MNKVLQRDKSNKVVAGVCGGLGKYFDFDPIIFRAIFLVLLFVGGGGIVLYVILWVVLPENPPSNVNNSIPDPQPYVPEENEGKESSSGNVNIPMGLLLLSAGILLLINNLVPNFEFDKFWPVVLIVVGGGLLIGRGKMKMDSENRKEPNHEEPQ